MNYVELLASTRRDLAASRKALADAQLWTTPLPAELRAELAAKIPEELAECDAKMAAIEAGIPALFQTVSAQAQALADLETRMCHRCNGNGVYAGASRWQNRYGEKTCFSCHGRGCKA